MTFPDFSASGATTPGREPSCAWTPSAPGAGTVPSQDARTRLSETLGFRHSVTGSLTLDDAPAGIDGLAGLAYSPRAARPDTITSMTVPDVYDPNDAANVARADEPVRAWDHVEPGAEALTESGTTKVCG